MKVKKIWKIHLRFDKDTLTHIQVDGAYIKTKVPNDSNKNKNKNKSYFVFTHVKYVFLLRPTIKLLSLFKIRHLNWCNNLDSYQASAPSCFKFILLNPSAKTGFKATTSWMWVFSRNHLTSALSLKLIFATIKSQVERGSNIFSHTLFSTITFSQTIFSTCMFHILYSYYKCDFFLYLFANVYKKDNFSKFYKKKVFF